MFAACTWNEIATSVSAVTAAGAASIVVVVREIKRRPTGDRDLHIGAQRAAGAEQPTASRPEDE